MGSCADVKLPMGRVCQKETRETDPTHSAGLLYSCTLRAIVGLSCQRDTAGNRTLHYDQYCMLVLLYVLNPTVSSLRSISQASELTKVRDKLGNKKASLGSLSEAGGLFSAELLKPIIETLSAQVTDAAPDPRLSGIKQTITAVDGSLVNALPSLITASILKQTTGSALVRWRLHTHFEQNIELIRGRRNFSNLKYSHGKCRHRISEPLSLNTLIF